MSTKSKVVKPSHDAFVVTGEVRAPPGLRSARSGDGSKGVKVAPIALLVSGRLVTRERKETNDSESDAVSRVLAGTLVPSKAFDCSGAAGPSGPESILW
ncbi:hypothetical protein EI171_11055 [Bradyrhizobium sp. LCT2]|nr:hypothetical protein EI171_11055 [Bradyrhizobium sp. LCT2]